MIDSSNQFAVGLKGETIMILRPAWQRFPLSPGVFRPVSDGEYVHVVMPVKTTS